MNSTVALIVALLGAAQTLTPEILAMLNVWRTDRDLTRDELAAIDAALAGDRAKVAEIYRRHGVA